MYVYFSDYGLKNRDKEANKLMFEFLRASVNNLDSRLTYAVYGLNTEGPKRGILIFDEFDELMYSDL